MSAVCPQGPAQEAGMFRLLSTDSAAAEAVDPPLMLSAWEEQLDAQRDAQPLSTLLPPTHAPPLELERSRASQDGERGNLGNSSAPLQPHSPTSATSASKLWVRHMFGSSATTPPTSHQTPPASPTLSTTTTTTTHQQQQQPHHHHHQQYHHHQQQQQPHTQPIYSASSVPANPGARHSHHGFDHTPNLQPGSEHDDCAEVSPLRVSSRGGRYPPPQGTMFTPGDAPGCAGTCVAMSQQRPLQRELLPGRLMERGEMSSEDSHLRHTQQHHQHHQHQHEQQQQQQHQQHQQQHHQEQQLQDQRQYQQYLHELQQQSQTERQGRQQQQQQQQQQTDLQDATQRALLETVSRQRRVCDRLSSNVAELKLSLMEERASGEVHSADLSAQLGAMNARCLQLESGGDLSGVFVLYERDMQRLQEECAELRQAALRNAGAEPARSRGASSNRGRTPTSHGPDTVPGPHLQAVTDQLQAANRNVRLLSLRCKHAEMEIERLTGKVCGGASGRLQGEKLTLVQQNAQLLNALHNLQAQLAQKNHSSPQPPPRHHHQQQHHHRQAQSITATNVKDSAQNSMSDTFVTPRQPAAVQTARHLWDSAGPSILAGANAQAPVAHTRHTPHSGSGCASDTAAAGSSFSTGGAGKARTCQQQQQRWW
ncbi:MAG: hypothetical protein WDW38_005144 [Sanguina aurantia]